eukprot:CAMPEP_0167742056 /NCGR_PEP_ID=MMETSP0110_2-20121227/1208_1 /TAXON_ID=629695 /ORGANISM="Gymnochlora sp., Strain CCMP2014" /LENGTH=128 /DNA_ID=CAMNT_0007626193 /DNA_START=353 /DNA_END=739 /DNA_ORIENTATION=+
MAQTKEGDALRNGVWPFGIPPPPNYGANPGQKVNLVAMTGPPRGTSPSPNIIPPLAIMKNPPPMQEHLKEALRTLGLDPNTARAAMSPGLGQGQLGDLSGLQFSSNPPTPGPSSLSDIAEDNPQCPTQ